MNRIAQIFPRTCRISGPEVADGAKPDVPTTDVENEKKKKHRVFYEAVDAHARRRLITLSASLCSARKLIKYSKPNVVRARRNAFMRDFPNFVDIYPICQPSTVLPDISLISLPIGSYLELAIFREDFSSVASVNVRFS